VRDTSSAFRLPDDPTRPVIMIAAGTGIAPFRGFLAERAALRAAGTELGPAVLVFGCRHPQTDMLYGDELPELAEAANAQLACAFSRVPGLPRIYVQDRIRQLANTVWPLLQDGAAIYVCGSTHMAAGRARRACRPARRAGRCRRRSERGLARRACRR
jgi:cytochrome P450/NADPH-cytochrome P450 reductase